METEFLSFISFGLTMQDNESFSYHYLGTHLNRTTYTMSFSSGGYKGIHASAHSVKRYYSQGEMRFPQISRLAIDTVISVGRGNESMKGM